MIRKGEVRKDSLVLVNRGSGAVGTAAVQMIKAQRTRVVAISSTRNNSFVKNLGADEVSNSH